MEAWSSLRRFRAANAECFGFEEDALDFGSCCQERRGEQTSDSPRKCGQTLCSASQFEDGAAAFFCFSMLSCAVREVDGEKGRVRGSRARKSENSIGEQIGPACRPPARRAARLSLVARPPALLHVVRDLHRGHLKD